VIESPAAALPACPPVSAAEKEKRKKETRTGQRKKNVRGEELSPPHIKSVFNYLFFAFGELGGATLVRPRTLAFQTSTERNHFRNIVFFRRSFKNTP